MVIISLVGLLGGKIERVLLNLTASWISRLDDGWVNGALCLKVRLGPGQWYSACHLSWGSLKGNLGSGWCIHVIRQVNNNIVQWHRKSKQYVLYSIWQEREGWLENDFTSCLRTAFQSLEE